MRWWGYFAATASRSSCDLPTRGWISFPVIPTLPGFTWEYQQEFPKSLRFDDSCLGKCCFPQKMGGSLLHFTTIVSWTNEDLENFGTWTSWTSYLSEASAVSLFAEVRQMDGHRASAWNKIAEDHRDWDAVEDHRWTLVPGFPLLKGMISWPKKWEACSQPRKKHRNPMESPSRTMKIPPVPLCFESFYVFFFRCFIWISLLAPKETWATLWRKFRASYAVHRWMKRQRRPCWRTRSGWGGSRYVCQVKRYEKVRCNVVNPIIDLQFWRVYRSVEEENDLMIGVAKTSTVNWRLLRGESLKWWWIGPIKDGGQWSEENPS